MIEIFVLIWLCGKNAKNAKLRGKSGGAASLYTLAIWIGLEIIGASIGNAADMGMGAYVLALAFAIVGGVISYNIAKSGEIVAPLVAESAHEQTAQFAAQNAPVATKTLEFDGNGKFVKATVPDVNWKEQRSGGSTYRSCNAPTLFRAVEILRRIGSIPQFVYYIVDTPDGSLGRDVFGFFTEAEIKFIGIHLETDINRTSPVESLSMTAFGNALQNQSSVAVQKSAGQYAKFILEMECGHCGYKSPVETHEGTFKRQCYACGTVNNTRRGKINVMTQSGSVAI